MNSALRNPRHHEASWPNEFGPTNGAFLLVFLRIHSHGRSPSRGGRETHGYLQAPAIEAFAQRNLRAVPIGNALDDGEPQTAAAHADRKSTRLNSSHRCISY